MNAEFWTRLCLAALVILGVYTLFLRGMLLEWLGEIVSNWVPQVALKPFFTCPPCMSSVWGTLVWFGTGGDVNRYWPLFCLALCGLLKLISIEWLTRHE